MYARVETNETEKCNFVTVTFEKTGIHTRQSLHFGLTYFAGMHILS